LQQVNKKNKKKIKSMIVIYIFKKFEIKSKFKIIN